MIQGYHQVYISVILTDHTEHRCSLENSSTFSGNILYPQLRVFFFHLARPIYRTCVHFMFYFDTRLLLFFFFYIC